MSGNESTSKQVEDKSASMATDDPASSSDTLVEDSPSEYSPSEYSSDETMSVDDPDTRPPGLLPFYETRGLIMSILAAQGRTLDRAELRAVAQDLQPQANRVARAVGRSRLGYPVRAVVDVEGAGASRPWVLVVLEPAVGGRARVTRPSVVRGGPAGVWAWQGVGEAEVRSAVAEAAGRELRRSLGLVAGLRVQVPVYAAWGVPHEHDGFESGVGVGSPHGYDSFLER